MGGLLVGIEFSLPCHFIYRILKLLPTSQRYRYPKRL